MYPTVTTDKREGAGRSLKEKELRTSTSVRSQRVGNSLAQQIEPRNPEVHGRGSSFDSEVCAPSSGISDSVNNAPPLLNPEHVSSWDEGAALTSASPQPTSFSKVMRDTTPHHHSTVPAPLAHTPHQVNVNVGNSPYPCSSLAMACSSRMPAGMDSGHAGVGYVSSVSHTLPVAPAYPPSLLHTGHDPSILLTREKPEVHSMIPSSSFPVGPPGLPSSFPNQIEGRAPSASSSMASSGTGDGNGGVLAPPPTFSKNKNIAPGGYRRTTSSSFPPPRAPPPSNTYVIGENGGNGPLMSTSYQRYGMHPSGMAYAPPFPSVPQPPPHSGKPFPLSFHSHASPALGPSHAGGGGGGNAVPMGPPLYPSPSPYPPHGGGIMAGGTPPALVSPTPPGTTSTLPSSFSSSGGPYLPGRHSDNPSSSISEEALLMHPTSSIFPSVRPPQSAQPNSLEEEERASTEMKQLKYAVSQLREELRREKQKREVLAESNHYYRQQHANTLLEIHAALHAYRHDVVLLLHLLERVLSASCTAQSLSKGGGGLHERQNVESSLHDTTSSAPACLASTQDSLRWLFKILVRDSLSQGKSSPLVCENIKEGGGLTGAPPGGTSAAVRLCGSTSSSCLASAAPFSKNSKKNGEAKASLLMDVESTGGLEDQDVETTSHPSCSHEKVSAEVSHPSTAALTVPLPTASSSLLTASVKQLAAALRLRFETEGWDVSLLYSGDHGACDVVEQKGASKSLSQRPCTSTGASNGGIQGGATSPPSQPPADNTTLGEAVPSEAPCGEEGGDVRYQHFLEEELRELAMEVHQNLEIYLESLNYGFSSGISSRKPLILQIPVPKTTMNW